MIPRTHLRALSLFFTSFILIFLQSVLPVSAAIQGNDQAFCIDPSGHDGVNTAIGCIPIDSTNDLVSKLVGWALGLAGGIAFILILVSGFQLATAAGDPKRVQAAQELLTSAITGLVLIALSVVAFNFLGVSVLNLRSLGFHG